MTCKRNDSYISIRKRLLLFYSSVMDKVNETHPPINIDIIFIEPQPVLLLLLLLVTYHHNVWIYKQ